ncbi:MAG: O-antigen ligase family protein [Myxococcales bacterium]|nr:O-antigen ligase family protein [Myxococcales bacterium]
MGLARLEQVHRVAVGALALLVGLMEGPAQVALALTAVTTLATGRLRGYRPGVIELGVLVWVLAGYAGLLDTVAPHISSAGALAPLHVLAVPVGARALRGLRLRPYVILALVGIGVNAAYGILQVLVGDLPLEEAIARRAPLESLRDPEAPHRMIMARGLFYNRLKLAHVGVVGLALAVLAALHGDKRDRWWAWLAAAVIGVAVLLTFRRAAPLALMVGFGALLFVRGKLRALPALVVAVGLLVAGLSFTGIGQRRAESFSHDVESRLWLFSLGLEIWREHPLVGVGHGAYESIAEPRLPPNGHNDLQATSPHNQALHVLAETGLLGALGFFFALGWGLWRLGRRLHESWDPVDALAVLALATLSALGAVHTVLYHPNVAIVWWLAMGVAVRRRSSGGAERSEAAAGPS